MKRTMQWDRVFWRNFAAVLLFFASRAFLFSQEKVTVQFIPIFAGKELVFDSLYVSEHDTVVVSELRFYISGMALQAAGKTFAAAEAVSLIDLKTGNNTVMIDCPAQSDSAELVFWLGTDSLVNVSGALSGALDPANGMYWAWQSGYINCKIEGRSSASAGRKQEFQFHLGGYRYPYATEQEVKLSVKTREKVALFLPLDAFFLETNMQKQHHIMRPCGEAVSLSRFLAQQFVTGK